MPEKQERQPRPHDDRAYEAPTITDLGAVDEFSQGDSNVSIDDR
jgi:hypothetical protein